MTSLKNILILYLFACAFNGFGQTMVTPTFSPVAAICVGGTLSPLPIRSTNNIIGTWTPALDNMTTTTYTFTPAMGQSATIVTLIITVNPIVTPTFTQVPPICAGTSLGFLTTTSTNSITGTWSPIINNAVTTTYYFTPTPGLCASPVSMTIVVNPIVTPTFSPVAAICVGGALSPLPIRSTNGITGTWYPAINNMATTTYKFTPAMDECARTATLTIVINQKVTPSFTPVSAICIGDSLAALPPTSNNGIIGTWNPAINNTTTTTYFFTPAMGECAVPTSMTIAVNHNIVTPTFTQVAAICAGATLSPLPIISNNNITGVWTPALNNTTTTLYTFSPDLDPCAPSVMLTIHVNQIVTPTFTPVASICSGDTLSPLPTTSNNGITGTWSPALDNTTTTTYTFAPDVDLCAPSVMLTIHVNQIVTPTFTPVASICSGDTLSPLPTTSNNGITGTWSPALNNTTITTYTFAPTAGECALPTTLTIDVKSIVTLTMSLTNESEDFAANQIISVTAIGGSGTYEYQLDGGDWQTTSTFENLRGCNEHTVAVRDVLRCSIDIQDTISILEYPKFFTPNNDGYNDTWNIKCLRDDPLAVVTIFDRFGKLLYWFKPSQNAWNGLYNGLPLVSNDYWFLVEYVKSAGIALSKKGHFSLRH